MTNDVYTDMVNKMGVSLFAEDGAIWKRGRNVHFIMPKMQPAIAKVEEWSYKWGVTFSVVKTKMRFFLQGRESILKLKLYNQELERVK